MATALAPANNVAKTDVCPMCGHRQSALMKTAAACAACGEDLTVATPVAKAKLFSPLQIAAVGFLGGWLAGFLVLSLNYLRLKRVGAALISTGLGMLVLVGWIKLAVSVPVIAKVPGMLLWLVVMGITLAIAKITQGATYNRHLAAGGEQAKGGAALGYMAAAIAISIGIGIGLLLMLV